MNNTELIVVLVAAFILWLLIRRTQKLIRRSRPADMENFRRRYVRQYSEHERLNKKKYERKLSRAKRPRKKKKLEGRLSFWKKAEQTAVRIAQKQSEPDNHPKKPTHGIRRHGTEKGRWKE